MTKGALRQRYIPLDPEWHDSDLFRALATDFGLGGPTVWLVLHAEWREPEAEIIERDGQPGLYRRCRFSYLWDKLPGIGNKKLAKVMLWLQDRGQWVLDEDTQEDLKMMATVGVASLHRGQIGKKHVSFSSPRSSKMLQTCVKNAYEFPQSTHLVGAWSSKWLAFREACFAYRRGEEKRGLELGSTEPNQDESRPRFKYVRNSETGEYDRVPLAEKKLREDLDA